MSYRVAIIGCGAMGEGHADAWSRQVGATIAAVYDPDAARCKALAEKTGARPCASLAEAVEVEGLDAASVCTPIAFHAEAACLAMEHGLHVLCEQAIALTLGDADRMIRTAEEKGVKLCVDYQHRSAPAHAAYKLLFDQGAFEGPVFARFEDIREVRPKLDMHRISRNGGPIVDMAGHFFDLMRCITGAEPRSVYARGHVFGRGKKRLSGIADLAVDAAEILVDFSDGHVLSVYVNWGMPEGFPGGGQSTLTSAVMRARPGEGGAEAIYTDRTETIQPPEGPQGVPARVQDLVTAIETGAGPEVDGPAARTTLAVCIAALESIETGRTVPVQA